jgi:hypothetical protein
MPRKKQQALPEGNARLNWYQVIVCSQAATAFRLRHVAKPSQPKHKIFLIS